MNALAWMEVPLVRLVVQFALAVALAGTCALAGATELLRIGANPWPGYAPLHLAAERNAWESELGVRIVEYPSATEVLRAFRNRTLEAAALTLDEVLVLQEAALPVAVVLVLDVSHGGDAIVAQPGIDSFGALKGRRIGVEGGALGAYVLSRALERNGLALTDVLLHHLEVSAHEDAFRRGQVDAVVTFEPVRSRLIAQGAVEVFTSRELPGEIVDVLVVRKDVLERHHNRLRTMVHNWFAELEHLEAEPAHAAEHVARLLRFAPGELERSLDGLVFPDRLQNRTLLEHDLPGTLVRLHAVLTTHGLLTTPAPPEDLLNAELVGD